MKALFRYYMHIRDSAKSSLGKGEMTRNHTLTHDDSRRSPTRQHQSMKCAPVSHLKLNDIQGKNSIASIVRRVPPRLFHLALDITSRRATRNAKRISRWSIGFRRGHVILLWNRTSTFGVPQPSEEWHDGRKACGDDRDIHFQAAITKMSHLSVEKKWRCNGAIELTTRRHRLYRHPLELMLVSSQTYRSIILTGNIRNTACRGDSIHLSRVNDPYYGKGSRAETSVSERFNNFIVPLRKGSGQ